MSVQQPRRRRSRRRPGQRRASKDRHRFVSDGGVTRQPFLRSEHRSCHDREQVSQIADTVTIKTSILAIKI
jgi:hypothetical protein